MSVKKLKIAIEFFGHIRTYKQTAKSIIENLIKPCGGEKHVDIFIHTWDETDSSNIVWHNINGEKRGSSLSEDDLFFLKEVYHPKKIEVSSQLLVSNEEFLDAVKRGHKLKKRGYYEALKNCAYSRLRVNSLRKEFEAEHNIRYDLVIQTRLDLVFFKKFDFFKEIDKLLVRRGLLNQIYYAWPGSDLYYYNNPALRGGATDLLLIGDPCAMDKLSNFFNQIDKFDFSKNGIAPDSIFLTYALQKHCEIYSFNYLVYKDFTVLKEYTKTDRLIKLFESQEKDSYKDLFFIFCYSFVLLFILLPGMSTFFSKRKYYNRLRESFANFNSNFKIRDLSGFRKLDRKKWTDAYNQIKNK